MPHYDVPIMLESSNDIHTFSGSYTQVNVVELLKHELGWALLLYGFLEQFNSTDSV
jgi:hypothetical protein